MPLAAVAWTLAALALAGGLAEVAISVFEIRGGGIGLLDPRSPWAAPLGNLALFAAMALAASVLGRLVGRRVAVLLTLTGAAALTVFAVVSLLPTRVHSMALAVLALGVGFQFARSAVGHPQGLHTWSRWVACGLVRRRLGGAARCCPPAGGPVAGRAGWRRSRQHAQRAAARPRHGARR